eukprot:TRINITY_DN89_c0_g1_i4.p2 TRINITY_DN89_c0_g1~~TRINITY_DN89_c0_g1_i4.p2  ORF type:complete len:505 (+),score=175.92 TRINITY_DN89_c0_g1_i4:79-1593(+)
MISEGVQRNKKREVRDDDEDVPVMKAPAPSAQSALCTANRVIVLLCMVAAVVAVWGLVRGRSNGLDFEPDRKQWSVTNFAAWPHSIPLVGKHWIVEFEGCDGGVLNDEQKMLKIVRDAVNYANASLVTMISKEFDHLGVTILALLSESHIGIHTWPQYGYAATDVFTCGHIAQPQKAVEWMSREFRANESATRYVYLSRGGAIASSDLRTLEENNDKKELIAYVKTPYQKAHIFWTETNGLWFLLDGTTQSVESDEHTYHESLVHPAMLAHPGAKSVLVIGAAEGAALREVLAHHSVEHATMVELDGEVVSLCREFMPTWSDGAFDDSRTTLIIDDGKHYIENKAADGQFDVIVMDAVDPLHGSNNSPLYSREFFRSVSTKLTSNGVFAFQSGQIDEDEQEGIAPFARILHDLHQVFPFVSYYTKYVRSYDGFMSYAIACMQAQCNSSPVVNPEASPSLVDKLISERITSHHTLQSFDGESNRGMFSVNRETRDALALLESQRK